MDSIDIGLLFIHRLLNLHTERTDALSPQLKSFLDQQMFAPMVQNRNYLPIIVQGMKDRDIYHLTDPLGVLVSLVRIGDSLCILGPYVAETVSLSELKKRFSEIHLDNRHFKSFQDYVVTLPFLARDSIYTATHTLLHGAVGYDSKATVYYVDLNESTYTRLQAEAAATPVSTMPERIYENVSTVDNNAGLLYRLETTLAEQMTNGRTADALATLNRINALHRHNSQAKDLDGVNLYSAVLCSQMSQTAIRAGVLPPVAEIKTRYFLALIQSAKTVSEAEHLRKIMMAQFCDVIRKEKLGSLSPKIRQVVQIIMADLSGSLTVDTLAAQVGLTPNYLSACFKKEVGQSLSSFIRDKRLESSEHFLAFTNMPIHEISTCVGITDFSYFTKVFREKYGETPSSYRRHKHSVK